MKQHDKKYICQQRRQNVSLGKIAKEYGCTRQYISLIVQAACPQYAGKRATRESAEIVTVTCKECGKKKQYPSYIAEKREFCSIKCSKVQYTKNPYEKGTKEWVHWRYVRYIKPYLARKRKKQ